jgi:hypothetical protein
MGGHEARIPMSALLKEQHYLNMQITSALWDTIGSKIQELKSATNYDAAQYIFRHVKGFMKAPAQTIEGITRLSTVKGAFDESKFINYMMQIGTAANLTPEEFGKVFGAVPELYGADWVQKTGARELGFGMKHFLAAQRMDPTGSIYVFRGDPSYAGKRASIEPRMFTALRTGAYGELGTDLANEIARRAIAAGPEQLIASREVFKTLESALGDITPEAGANIFKLSEQFDTSAWKQFSATGGYIEMPGKLPSIYMPGQDQMKLMMPFRTAEGSMALSELAKTYRDVAREASLATAGGDIAIQEFASMEITRKGNARGAFWRFVNDVQSAQAIFGKGSLGLLRGERQRPYGTRFLTLASAMGDEAAMAKFQAKADIMTVGISDKYFNQMISELAESGVERAEIERLRKAFIGGEKIGGAMWRHPTIGRYSTNIVNLMRVEAAGDAPLAIVQSTLKGLNISPTTAMAADFDGDTAGVMLLHGKTERQAMQTSQSLSEAYISHAVRMQYLKPKAPGADMITAKDLSRIAIEKLGTPQEYVPKISLPITEAKEAIAAFSGDPRFGKALSLLELLEQVPISGKHIPEKQLLENINAFKITTEGLLDALREPSAVGIQAQTEALFKHTQFGDPKIARLLNKGITLAGEELEAIRKVAPNFSGQVSGLDLQSTSEFIAESIKRFNASEAAMNYRLMAGRATVKSPGMLRQYVETARHSIGLQAKRSTAGQIMAKAKLIIDNIQAAGGQRLLRGLKPLGLGLLAAVGVGAALSPSLDPSPPPPEVLAARQPRAMSPDMIQPPEHTMGSTSVPGMFPNSARIMGQKSYNIVGNFVGDAVDSAGLSRMMQGAVNNVGRMSVNVTDMGSSPGDQHALLNDIYR